MKSRGAWEREKLESLPQGEEPLSPETLRVEGKQNSLFPEGPVTEQIVKKYLLTRLFVLKVFSVHTETKSQWFEILPRSVDNGSVFVTDYCRL